VWGPRGIGVTTGERMQAWVAGGDDMASRHMAILLAAAAQGCIITEPAPGAEAYRASVARALSYYEGSEKRYLISTPQQGLTGRLDVCTREEIVDSSGNHRGWSDDLLRDRGQPHRR
jgi:hypothetical protein